MDFISVQEAQSHLRAIVGRALGEALILGIDQCEQEGRPLTQTQQIDVATMHVMAYDHAIKGCDLMEIDLHSIAKIFSGRVGR